MKYYTDLDNLTVLLPSGVHLRSRKGVIAVPQENEKEFLAALQKTPSLQHNISAEPSKPHLEFAEDMGAMQGADVLTSLVETGTPISKTVTAAKTPLPIPSSRPTSIVRPASGSRTGTDAPKETSAKGIIELA